MFVPDYFDYMKTKNSKDIKLIVNIDHFEIKSTDTYHQATEKELNLKNAVLKNFFKKADS